MGKIIVFLLVMLTLACTPSPQQYELEASALCDLYAPERWANTQNKSVIENYDQLNQQIRETINSEAFLDIFEHLSNADYTDYYSAIQPEISQLTGKEWQCDDMHNFYAIKWEKQGASGNSNTNTFTVTKDGFIQLGDNKIAYTNTASIKATLTSIKNKSEKLIVKIPESFQEQELDQLLILFREAGILKLSISYY